MTTARITFAALAAAIALAGCNRPAPDATADAGASAASAPPAAGAAASAAASAAGALIPPAAASAPTDAQRSAGQQIASQGGGGPVAACSSCHGAQGEGNAAAGFPRIAGQGYAYLLHQLNSYADGSRNNPTMAPIAKAMSTQQRENAAAYYASLTPAGDAAGAAPVASAPSGAATAASAASGAGRTAAAASAAPAAASAGDWRRGLQLAGVGDESKAVQACANCHGPGGIGENGRYPYLAGQHATYLVNALGEWRDGSRRNDPTGQMPAIARQLGEADAQAVAAYYAQQRPPAAPSDAAPAPQPAASPASAVVSGPREAAASGAGALQGTGTEQGTSTMGGSQGIGGGGAATGAGPQGNTTGNAAVPANRVTGSASGAGSARPADSASAPASAGARR